jgi:mannose-1-phosphate guanylyltransferase
LSESLHVVIMAGGSGTRFWPFSRQARPKHVLQLLWEESLLQQTVSRSLPATAADRIWIITTAPQVEAIREQLPDVPVEQIIAEPEGRNTAPCIGLAARMIHARDPEAVMAVLPADHRVSPAEAFAEQLATAGEWSSRENLIVTIGIPPTFPATGYGYIERGAPLPDAGDEGPFTVGRFVEKPDEATAQSYLDAGTFAWNAGMFVAPASLFLAEIETHLPDLHAGLAGIEADPAHSGFEASLAAVYPTLPKVSVDYGIMEKTERVAVMTSRFSWDDLGAWPSLEKYLARDDQDNATLGTTVSVDAGNNILVADGDHVVAAVGVEDLIIVHTEDATLVVPRAMAQRVRDVVDRLDERHS